MQLSIPQPCEESWEEMEPGMDSRFCNRCSSHVMDFSNRSEKEIEAYFLLHQDNKICGRFRPEQIEAPLPEVHEYVIQVHHSSLPFLKRVAALILFVLVLQGPVSYAQAQIPAKVSNQRIMGAPLAQTSPKHQPNKDTVKKPRHEAPRPIMGKVAMPVRHAADDTVKGRVRK